MIVRKRKVIRIDLSCQRELKRDKIEKTEIIINNHNFPYDYKQL